MTRIPCRHSSRPRTHAQEKLLYTLGVYGPMEGHELHWKSDVRSERLFWSSLAKLLERGDVALRSGTEVVSITAKGRRS